jgi:hypothetical protein
MDDKIGFRAELRFFNKVLTIDDLRNGNWVDFGDWANVWWKPLDMLKFDVGEFNGDTLRGKVGNDNWHNYTVGAGDEDAIFQRFRGDIGAMVSLTPIPGLYIGVLVPDFKPCIEATPDMTGSNNSDIDSATRRALRVYEKTQVGVGYELNGIGLVRAQFVGANGGDGARWSLPTNLVDVGAGVTGFSEPRFELAFAFTGMEGLVIDFGVKAYIPISDWVTNEWDESKEEYKKLENTPTVWRGLQFALGAGFNTGALKINARVDALNIAANADYDYQGVTAKYSVGPTINFHLWPSYDLGICELGVDFGLNVKLIDKYELGSASVDVKNDDFQVGFGLWAKKAYGNGSIKGGIAYRLGNANDGNYTYPGVLSIPIIFDYSF